MKPCRGGRERGRARWDGRRGSAPPAEKQLPRGLSATPWIDANDVGAQGRTIKHPHLLSTVTFSLACKPHEGKCWICAHPLLRSGVSSAVQTSETMQRVEIPAVEKTLASMRAEAHLETGKFSDSEQ